MDWIHQSIVECCRRRRGGWEVGEVGEALGGGDGEEEVLADAGADALRLARAERPPVEGDDAVREKAVRELVVLSRPATWVAGRGGRSHAIAIARE